MDNDLFFWEKKALFSLIIIKINERNAFISNEKSIKMKHERLLSFFFFSNSIIK